MNKLANNSKRLKHLLSLNLSENQYPSNNDGDVYYKNLIADFQQLTPIIHALGQFDGLGDTIIPTCKFNLTLDNENNTLDACTYIYPEKICNFYISIGTMLAFDDIFHRVLSNKGVFSNDLDYEGNLVTLHSGTSCYWTERSGEYFPEYRYFNYSPKYIQGGLGKINDFSRAIGRKNFLSRYFSALPIGDTNRMKLANDFTSLSILWVLLHEESHYWEGHLHFLNQKTGLAKISEQNQSDSHRQFYSIHENILRNKVFEWKADMKATEGLLGILFQPSREVLFTLPDYANNTTRWKIRSLVLVVGLTFLMLEKSHEKYGTAHFYPSPKSRLIGAVNRILEVTIVWKKYNLESNEIITGLILGLYDIVYSSDLMYHISDLPLKERTKKISKWEDKINFFELAEKELYQESLKLFENGKEDQIISMILDALLSGGQKIKPEDIELEKEWFSEFKEFHSFFTSFDFDNDMKKYRRETLVKGHINADDRDFSNTLKWYQFWKKQ